MEHAVESLGVDPPSITIPYLCGDHFQYDSDEEFLHYGESLGFDGAKKRFLQSQDNAGDLAEIMQKWLFFGLITEAFGVAGIKLTTGQFVRTNDKNRAVISTISLTELLRQWANAIPTLNSEMRSMAAIKIQQIAGIAQTKSKYLGKHLVSPVSEVHLSVSLVGAALIHAIRHVFRAGGTCPVQEWTDSVPYRSWGKSKILVEEMISKGWCIYEVAQLYSTSFSAVGMVFCAALERPRRRETHGNCTEKVCRAFDVDELTYQTRHVSHDCDCANLKLEHDEICSIIKSGSVVILKSELDGDNQLVLKAVPSQGLDYIAISHVWSDGLGNAFQNSLPRCQLTRLDGMVRNVLSASATEPIYFWMDTMCVTAREIAKDCTKDVLGLDCRQLAILQMRDTYRDAAEVLVLDWQLEHSIAGRKAVENLARVLVSGWMRRLWTFQEAWLSKKIAIQFQNKLIRLRSQLMELEMPDHTPVWAEVAEVFLSTQKGILSDAGQSQQIALLWNALQSRTTSYTSDEAFVLGTILGMNITDILKEDRSRRMFKLLSSIDVYPSQILYMPGPRMEEPGYGWAPSSFFGRQRWTPASALEDNFLSVAEVHSMNIACRPAFRSDSGLLLRASGFLLEPLKEPLCHAFSILIDGEKFLGMAHYIEVTENQEWYDRKIEEYNNLAVVTEPNISRGRAVLAVLVSDCTMMGSILFAKFVCRMWFGASSTTERIPGGEDYAVDQESGRKFSMLGHAKATKVDQMWCIG